MGAAGPWMWVDGRPVPPCAAEDARVSTWLTRDVETERLSDHYPLLSDLDCEAW